MAQQQTSAQHTMQQTEWPPTEWEKTFPTSAEKAKPKIYEEH